MLSDFFRINLPYGIARNERNEWMAFNRDYLPIGYNDVSMKGLPGRSYLDLPVYTKYKKVPEKLLLELADDESSLQRDENGEISKVFLYDDGTNPVNRLDEVKDLWVKYFKKLEKLSELRID
ncbi:hypothetical protein EMN47_20345 [Prolixibacteraceae bacterium JC049]|nr:hypothetical protein [Prolixibacteraceae bacterium JC049]